MFNEKNSVYGVLYESYLTHKKDVALYYKSKKFTYTKVIDRVNSFAYSLIELGIKKDDVVTYCLPNIPEAVYLFYAINQIGAIANIIHPLMKHGELEQIMIKTNSKILFCLDTNLKEFIDFKDKGIKLFSVCPAHELGIKHTLYKFINRKVLYKGYDINKFYKNKKYTQYDKKYEKDSFYLHSGGTTGNSKTIALSNFSLNALIKNVPWLINESDTKGEYMLSVLPMFHGFGLCIGIHALLGFGGTDVLIPKFNTKETLSYLKKGHLSILVGVPTLYEALLRNEQFDGDILKYLNVAFVGGDFVSDSLINRFNERMIKNGSKCRLYQGYGLTETVTVASVNTHYHAKDGTVGMTLPNVKVKVIDENGNDLGFEKDGEICFGGDTLMNGYRFDKDIVDPFIYDKDGNKWVKTGDFGSITSDNFIYFKQRLKRIIKVSGVNVFPSDIENCLHDNPKIYDCCVIGKEDEKHGSIVKLFVILDKKYEGNNIDEEIKEMVKDKCGVYAIPREIEYVDKFERTLVGKIDTKKLK